VKKKRKRNKMVISKHGTFNLWIHDERFSKHDVVINPEYFTGIRIGDLLEIYHPISGSSLNTQNVSETYVAGASGGRIQEQFSDGQENARQNKIKKLILQVESIDKEISSKQPQLQVCKIHHNS